MFGNSIYIPPQGGGSGQNLGTHDLTQTDATRVFDADNQQLDWINLLNYRIFGVQSSQKWSLGADYSEITTNFSQIKAGTYNSLGVASSELDINPLSAKLSSGTGYVEVNTSAARLILNNRGFIYSGSGDLTAYNAKSMLYLAGIETVLDSDYAASSDGARISLGFFNTFTDHNTVKKGFEYAAKYHATYTNRSMVDKEYVDLAAGAGLLGSGTNNYVTKWTPNGTTLGNSQIQDNGSTLSIGASLDVTIKLLTLFTGSSAGTAVAGYSTLTSAGNNVGVTGQSYGTAPAGSNIGGFFFASGGLNNYALKLQDGSQGIGKFLKSIDANGNANWANITTADITSGLSGTTDYLARWTSSTNLGIGIVRDNGTTIGINFAPQVNSLITSTSNKDITLDINNSKSTGDPSVISVVMNGSVTTTTSTAIKALVGNTTGIAYGIYSEYQSLTSGIADSVLLSTGDGVAGYFKAHATTGISYGIIGVSAPVGSSPSVTNIGGRFYASNGGTNYGVQIQDGSEGSGKFLKSVTANGSSNWANILVSDITNSTTLALGLGSIELGHATDTTLSRISAGVLGVEGVAVPTISSTSTFTNKRITSRVQSVGSSATVTPSADNDDSVEITAQAAGLTIASPSGTPTSHQKLIIRIKDNGTARAITWNAIYRAVGVTLPTTTVISKTVYLGFIYNAADTKWDCVAINQEA